MDAKRDWGHAKDYIEGMYLILQQDEPDDFVLATGITTTIREFVRLSFLALQIEIDFRGKGINEEGYITKNNSSFKVSEGLVVVKVDPKYFRPTEVDLLIGDASKAFKKLNWSPKYNLSLLIQEMIESDLDFFKKELLIKENGFGGIR
jgi:GDPmannose 4,6-dehydratase